MTSSSLVPPLHFTLGNFHATFSCNFFMQLNIPFLQATAHATGCRPEHKTFQTSHFMHVRCTLIHIRQLSCNFSMQLYQATVMQLYQATFMQLFHATSSGNFHATFPCNFIRQLPCNFSRQLYQATFMQLFQATFMQRFDYHHFAACKTITMCRTQDVGGWVSSID